MKVSVTKCNSSGKMVTSHFQWDFTNIVAPLSNIWPLPNLSSVSNFENKTHATR